MKEEFFPQTPVPSLVKTAKKNFPEGLETISPIAKELFNFMLNEAVVDKKHDPIFMKKFEDIVLDRFTAVFAAKTEAQLKAALDKLPKSSLRYEAECLARRIKNPWSIVEKKIQDFVDGCPKEQDKLFSSYVSSMGQSDQVADAGDDVLDADMQIDMFLSTISTEYVEAIRNIDGSTWGGDIELGRIVNLPGLNINIVVFQALGEDGDIEEIPPFNTNNPSDETKTIYILYNGVHYEMCDKNGKKIGKVTGDGNCLFRAIVQQTLGRDNPTEEEILEAVGKLRGEIADVLLREINGIAIAQQGSGNPIIARFMRIFAARNMAEFERERGLLHGPLLERSYEILRNRWAALAHRQATSRGMLSSSSSTSASASASSSSFSLPTSAASSLPQNSSSINVDEIIVKLAAVTLSPAQRDSILQILSKGGSK